MNQSISVLKFSFMFMLMAFSIKTSFAKDKSDILKEFKISKEYSKLLKNYSFDESSPKMIVTEKNVIITEISKTNNAITRAISYINNGQVETIVFQIKDKNNLKDVSETSIINGEILLMNADGEELRKVEILNNIIVAESFTKLKLTPITDCVAKKIDDMGWIEYGLCAITAPECLAGLVLICAGEIYL